jgi:hypothetical protein
MTVKERLAFGLFVLMVHLHAYQLCCLLFMVEQGTWTPIDLKDIMMLGNLQSFGYKEQRVAHGRGEES